MFTTKAREELLKALAQRYEQQIAELVENNLTIEEHIKEYRAQQDQNVGLMLLYRQRLNDIAELLEPLILLGSLKDLDKALA